jgi:HAD superfamily hydrolase (TIGR01549 family)
MVKGIIFDFDDTLVNSQETYWQIFLHVARSLNLPVPKREELAARLKEGLALSEIISKIYPALGREAIANCADKMREASREVMKEFPVTVKPEVREVLGLLRTRGIKIGLVTGRVFPSERMWSELRELGLSGFFDAVVTGSDQPRKPAPDGIIACLAQLDLSAEDVVLVGDAKSDLIAGKRAGVRVIVLNEGSTGGTSGPEQPDMVIDNLAKLMKFMEQEAAA